MSTIAERVAAGAAFLDEHDPDWWRADVERAIDLDTLDLGSGYHCILGQRCPLEFRQSRLSRETNYTAWGYVLSGAPDWAGIDDWAAARGFQVTRYPDDHFTALTAEWRRVIEARRSVS